jgi:hypothetical protein
MNKNKYKEIISGPTDVFGTENLAAGLYSSWVYIHFLIGKNILKEEF